MDFYGHSEKYMILIEISNTWKVRKIPTLHVTFTGVTS